MKRIRQWFLNGIAALLLALWVATVAMWVRSFYWGEQFTFERNHVAGKQERMTSVWLWSTCAGLDVGIMRGVGQTNPSAEMFWFNHFRVLRSKCGGRLRGHFYRGTDFVSPAARAMTGM